VPQESKSSPKKASWPADKVERRKVKDLAAEMADLKGPDFDITLTGFALDDIDTEAGDGVEDAPDSKYKEQFGVIVICKDEAHQQEVFESLAGSE
jgi:hypothetical protein